jgi:serine/threonine-protein kinase
MAQVWAARLLGQGGFSKIVALKMIRPELASDHEFVQMFLDEARIAAKLRHPNVCETFDLGEDNDTLFIAMEWVDGVSLLRLVRTAPRDPSQQATDGYVRQPIAPRLAARIIADACAGLHAAHELVDDDGTPLGVVHRDVSPQNLLVSATGIVKVTDFGVAMARGKSHATATGQIKGKISYMSSEQLKAAPIDGRSDVFALGCVLYEITTGRRPFPGTSDGEIVGAILLGEVVAPSTLDPTYASELETIVMCAVAPEPDARFATADAMRLALEAYLAKGQPVAASAIAELVKERCGVEIERRRAQIRTECANRGTLSAPPPAAHRRSSAHADTIPEKEWKAAAAKAKADADSSGSSLPSAVVAIRPRGKTNQRLRHALLGGLLAAMLVGIGWYVVAARTRPAVTAVGAGPDERDRRAEGAAAVSASAQALGSNPAGRRVTFHVSPPNAVLVVDGVTMPAGVDTVERPADGSAMRVIVRADRHEDRVEMIDPSTPPILDVVLLQRGGPRVRSRASGARGAASAGSARPGTAMPNPYE